MASNNIHPVKNLLLKREDKELITGRKGRVFGFMVYQVQAKVHWQFNLKRISMKQRFIL